MINTDVAVIRPEVKKLQASDLKEGELFITASCINEEDILPYVRCAVCFYDEDDTDIRTVRPFHPHKSDIDLYNELGYVDSNDMVYRVEIVASELKIVK